MRITLHPSFILHSRPYRESSLLLDVFTKDYGRISLIARGVKKSRSALRPLLQAFYPLLLSWQGKSELMTLVQAECNELPLQLHHDCLLSGFYLNELLVRLLQKHDPHPDLFSLYHSTLLKLQGNELQQKYLRIFEKNLLTELGYGIQLETTVPGNKPILPDAYYHFQHEQGFRSCDSSDDISHPMVFLGKRLQAFANEEFPDEETLRDAKRLMRMALARLLGHAELQSRKLFKTEVKINE